MADIKIYKVGERVAINDSFDVALSDLEVIAYAGGVQFYNIEQRKHVLQPKFEFSEVLGFDGTVIGTSVKDVWQYLFYNNPLGDSESVNTAVKDGRSVSKELENSEGKRAYNLTVLGNRDRFEDSNEFNDIFSFDENQRLYTFPLSGDFEFQSDDNGDAFDVWFNYIDTSGNIIARTISLTGTTQVVESITDLQCYLFTEVKTASQATGMISISRGGAAFSCICPNRNRSREAVLKVPTGFDGYITEWRGSIERVRGDFDLMADFNQFTKEVSSGNFSTIDSFKLFSDDSEKQFLESTHIPEGATVKIACTPESTQAGRSAQASFKITLIEK